MMIYSSPCNPSGSVYSKEELRSLADVLVNYPSITVVSDEIYEHINFTGSYFSIGAFSDMYNQVVTINGVSKSFAMTGWRLGYIGAPLSIAQACTKIQGQFTSGTSGISQRAAIAAVSADPSVVHEMRDAFLSRRDFILEELNKINGIIINQPQGAFYVFPDISYFFGKSIKGKYIKDANEFSLFLLEEAGVASVTGAAFGAPNCIRLSYAASESVLREAIDRIQKALQ